ncbi:hypothetical protein T31B1_14775 [Salinisphaera sp. T31B1]
MLAAVLALAGCGDNDNDIATGDTTPRSPPSVRAVSSMPEYVSGGSALVDIGPDPSGAAVTVQLNGVDITDAFEPSPTLPGHMLGLVTDLEDGSNTLVASQDGRSTRYELTSYPITGPIVSGPHQDPFICQTAEFLLPDGTSLQGALDDDCTAAPQVTYLYLPDGGDELVPLGDTGVLPDDVAMTTTSTGATRPFVVRVDTATVDRGIYQSAVLHDPTTEEQPSPFNPPKGWNRRLIAVEGFGCPGGWYIQGASQGNLSIAGADFTLLNVRRLGEGYATFANTLQHASNNCNHVLASEAAMMSKEQFIKNHGEPEFTVSAGCSGGSYGSALPADRIPGLFDGILIACTFPDPLTIALSASDGRLLQRYWEQHPGEFSDDEIAAVTGNKTAQAHLDLADQARRTDPVPVRPQGSDISGYAVDAAWNDAVPVDLRYDPDSNPTGARPTVYDASRNIYGVDNDGYALRPFDNIGVQYGLAALDAGTISVAQFLDLNAGAGGYDRDANFARDRSQGDPGAMRRAQQSGLQLAGNGGLASIPIFDITGIYNDDGGYHYQWFHFALRERLLVANGDTDNHVMWRGDPVPYEQAWSTFIAWVMADKADTAQGTQRDKVIRNRPAAAVDGCWRDETTFIAERQTLGTDGSQCNELFPSWSFPRYVAGGPLAANIMKCDLKPVSREDYGVTFTDAEWTRLQEVFPDGVCDWSEPGSYTGVVANGSFGPSPVNLVYDITDEVSD